MLIRTVCVSIGLIAATTGIHAAAPPPDWRPVLHTFSWHARAAPSDVRPWNEHNIGLGLRTTWRDRTAVQAGVFKNSNHRTSVYLITDWMPLQHGTWRLGGFGGLASGYTQIVVGGLLLRHEGSHLNTTLRLTPKPHSHGSAALALEFGWSK